MSYTELLIRELVQDEGRRWRGGTTVSLGICEGLVSGLPQIPKSTHSNLKVGPWELTYKKSQPFISTDFVSRKYCIFHLCLVLDAKAADTEDRLYLLKKKFVYKWTHEVQTCVAQGLTLILFHNENLLFLHFIFKN